MRCHISTAIWATGAAVQPRGACMRERRRGTETRSSPPAASPVAEWCPRHGDAQGASREKEEEERRGMWTGALAPASPRREDAYPCDFTVTEGMSWSTPKEMVHFQYSDTEDTKCR